MDRNRSPVFFSQSSALFRHLELVDKWENSYTCSICSKSFARNETLKEHILIPTGEKTYSCLVCEKSYAVNSALGRHARVHTREKLYFNVLLKEKVLFILVAKIKQ